MDFDTAFAKLIGNEGGYVNDPSDPGGETKYGISKRSYPSEDIPNLTLERAKYIYHVDFWGPCGADSLPDLLKFEMFDLAVNTSAPRRPVTAIKMLQEAVHEVTDGIFGPRTLQAVQSMDPARALRRLQAIRLRYYTALDNNWWLQFGKGVVNRVANNMLGA